MGNFSEDMKATILRDFHVRAVEQEGTSCSWRWNTGVILFPEGLCPWCKESIQSHSIWKVRTVDGGHDLVGRWQLVGGVLRREQHADHPHVRYRTGGAICVGTTGSVTSALFFNMNPRDVFWQVDGMSRDEAWSEWLERVWDHDCPVISRPCGHLSQHACIARSCPIGWVNGTAGCACGCYCHPQGLDRCRCRTMYGHEDCRCGLAEGENAPQSDTVDELAEDDDDDEPFVCACGDNVDHDCSDCCRDYREAEYRHNEGECDVDDCIFDHD